MLQYTPVPGEATASKSTMFISAFSVSSEMKSGSKINPGGISLDGETPAGTGIENKQTKIITCTVKPDSSCDHCPERQPGS